MVAKRPRKGPGGSARVRPRRAEGCVDVLVLSGVLDQPLDHHHADAVVHLHIDDDLAAGGLGGERVPVARGPDHHLGGARLEGEDLERGTHAPSRSPAEAGREAFGFALAQRDVDPLALEHLFERLGRLRIGCSAKKAATSACCSGRTSVFTGSTIRTMDGLGKLSA